MNNEVEWLLKYSLLNKICFLAFVIWIEKVKRLDRKGCLRRNAVPKEPHTYVALTFLIV